MEPSFPDDAGHARPTGNVWTAFAHVIAGSGILSLVYPGRVAGPLVLLPFAFGTYYTAAWLADCNRFPNPVTGRRSYRYKDVVNAWLGRKLSFACAWLQYSNLFATAIGCTLTGGRIMGNLALSHSYYMSTIECDSFYVIMFGVIQLVLSQIPNLDKLWWLSTIATIASFLRSTLLLVFPKLAGSATFTLALKYEAFQAFASLGYIAMAYSFSAILVEIQGTLRAPPAENKTMKRATLLAMVATTGSYACVHYAAFRNGYNSPHWMGDFLDACLVVHMIGAVQVFSQPIFECLEAWVLRKRPHASFSRPRSILNGLFSFTLFKLVSRSLFVIVITAIALVMLMVWPFFERRGKGLLDLALVSAVGFWPLTVYFPVEMYIRQAQIKCWSGKWICMELLSLFCLLISIAAAKSLVKDIWYGVQYANG